MKLFQGVGKKRDVKVLRQFGCVAQGVVWMERNAWIFGRKIMSIVLSSLLGHDYFCGLFEVRRDGAFGGILLFLN